MKRDASLSKTKKRRLREERSPLAASVGNSVTTDAAKRHEESRPKDCADSWKDTELPTIQARLVASVLLVVVSFLDLTQRHVSYAPQILTNFVTNFHQVIYYQTFLGSAQKKG